MCTPWTGLVPGPTGVRPKFCLIRYIKFFKMIFRVSLRVNGLVLPGAGWLCPSVFIFYTVVPFSEKNVFYRVNFRTFWLMKCCRFRAGEPRRLILCGGPFVVATISPICMCAHFLLGWLIFTIELRNGPRISSFFGRHLVFTTQFGTPLEGNLRRRANKRPF